MRLNAIVCWNASGCICETRLDAFNDDFSAQTHLGAVEDAFRRVRVAFQCYMGYGYSFSFSSLFLCSNRRYKIKLEKWLYDHTSIYMPEFFVCIMTHVRYFFYKYYFPSVFWFQLKCSRSSTVRYNVILYSKEYLVIRCKFSYLTIQLSNIIVKELLDVHNLLRKV
jgi:hypothetical protein